MQLFKYAVIATGLGLAVSAAQAGNIPIVNGDFGAPAVPGNFTTTSAPGSIPGWNVTGGSIDLIGTYWQASPLNGSGQSVDLDGNNPGTIQQTGIALSAGTATVSFDLAGNTDGGSATKTVQVDLLGLTPQVLTFNTTGDSRSSMGWTSETATFIIPAAGDYTLQFASLDDSSSPYGPALDNIAMNQTFATPEAGSTALLCGMGMTALAVLRRKLA